MFPFPVLYCHNYLRVVGVHVHNLGYNLLKDIIFILINPMLWYQTQSVIDDALLATKSLSLSQLEFSNCSAVLLDAIELPSIKQQIRLSCADIEMCDPPSSMISIIIPV